MTLCRTPARHNAGYTPSDALRLLDRVTARAAGVAAEAATAAGGSR